MLTATSQRSRRSQRPNYDFWVAEDNIANQKVAVRMLRSLGYEAVVVDNGVDAVARVEAERFDVVLMDVHMPEMDGLEATRRIRRMPVDRQPRIFAMTASALDSEREECLDAGMELHISKPVSRNALADALAQVTPSGEPRTAVEIVDAATDVGDSGAVIDLAELARSVGDEGVVEIVEAILDGSEQAIADLDAALERGDAPIVRRHAHTIKTNTAMVGAAAVSDDFAELEALAKTGDLGDAGPIADRARTGYAAALDAMRGWLVEAGSSS